MAHPRRLDVIRHGQSAGNVANDAARAGGLEVLDLATRDMDVPLSDLGRAQAEALGTWFAGVDPDVVVTSPYRRAVDTARLALDAAGAVDRPLRLDERLREREFGILDRLTRAGHSYGQYVSPDDAYLVARGLRTLGVRLRQHELGAVKVAHWLKDQSQVARVLHPAFADAAGHEYWKRDFTGSSGLFSIVLKPCSHGAVAAMVDGLDLFGMGYSWGGFESLILPFNPSAYRSATTWDAKGPALRLHIGLEDIEDLKADLDAGFARLRAQALPLS